MWNRVVLQACTNDSIKQLTIATVALKKAGKEPSAGLAVQHLRYALHEYGRALKGAQTTLSLQPESLRLVLIAALLVFILESMFGGTRRAVMNIQTMLNLIKQQLLPKAHALRGPFITNAFLPPNFPDLIEEEILESFLQSDCFTLRPTTRIRGPYSQCRTFSSDLHLEDFRFPERFSSITEARFCYERCGFKVFPEHVFESKLHRTTTIPAGASAPAIVVMELLSETKHSHSAPTILQDLTRWHRAFSPLLECLGKEEGYSTYVAMATLQIQAIAIEISVHGFNDRVRPIVPDSVASAARNVVQLSKILVADPRFSRTFVLEMGIIPCLWIVVILYPDFNLKREAIAVLREMQPRAECLWDSKFVADTGDVVVGMLERQQLGENLHTNLASLRSILSLLSRAR